MAADSVNTTTFVDNSESNMDMKMDSDAEASNVSAGDANFSSQQTSAVPSDISSPHQFTHPEVPQAPSPELAQTGSVVQGPGGKREQKLYTPPKLTSYQQDAISKAKKYAMEQSIKSVLLKQTLLHQQQMAQYQTALNKPMAAMGNSQITEQVWTKLGTIYVGSINYDVKEEVIKTAFLPFGPIKNVSVSWDPVTNKHKGFAFVEYDVPEAATLALDQMNGVIVGGRNVKVGRPSNMPQAQPIIERLMEQSKPYNRIYIASIHTDLSESDIQSVFEAFGKIKSCRLSPDLIRPGKHRGFGFIEYETAQAAQDAVASMNLFNLGGQYLRVGKAVTPPNTQQVPSFPTPMPTAAAVAAAAVTAKITAMDAVGGVPGMGTLPSVTTMGGPGVVIPQMGSSAFMSAPAATGSRLGTMPMASGLPPPTVAMPTFGGMEGSQNGGTKRQADDDASIASQENMAISGTQARHMVMQRLMRQSESRVMVLRNMVGPEDVDEDLESEVIDECSSYGHVNRVIIYQEKQSEDDHAEVIVKIFVEFNATSDMEKATKALNGRFFAGRQIKAEAFDQNMFEANDLSG